MAADPLARLAETMAAARQDGALVRIGGPIREVTASACRIGGVSPFVRLGDRMAFEAGGREQVGEIVRVDAEGATLKAYESRRARG